MLSFEENEAAAEYLRAMARVGRVETFLTVGAIVRALGGTVCPGAPSGCRAAIQRNPLKVWVPDSPAVVNVNKAGGHELGHLAQDLRGLAPDEGDATRIGAAVILPRVVLAATLSRVGWHARNMVRAFPKAPKLWTLGRFAMLFGGAVIVRSGGRRQVWSAPEVVLPHAACPWEREYLKKAAASPARVYEDVFGVSAWIMSHPAERAQWSGIVVPPYAVDAVVQRLHDDAFNCLGGRVRAA